jgi:SAM-dependent methyltransferase
LLNSSRLRDFAVKELHRRFVTHRRARVLIRHLGELIPRNSKILDVGCGDGLIDEMILAHRPDVTIDGIDVFLRPQLRIPVIKFDGERIPYSDNTFDVVLLLDVLHHTIDPLVLLKEAQRVSQEHIIIKDHNCDGFAATLCLRVMDWVGNAPHRVALPYNYWSQRRWRWAFGKLGLDVSEYRDSLGLYSPPGSWIFERSLHFIARLTVPRTT